MPSDELKPERPTITVTRERLPWSEITESERQERLRTIIKHQQEAYNRQSQEINDLRELVLNHRHGADDTLLIPAGRRSSGGGICCEAINVKPGQEWF